MKLRTIFDQLSFGELSQIDMGGAEVGHISESNYKKIAAHVSLGLTELHKRFLLKEGMLYLDVQPGQTYYTLDSKYAVSNTGSLEPVKYIDDVWAPFGDDLFKVERVYDETPATIALYPLEQDRELPLNRSDNADSCKTPNYKTLVIPSDLEATRLKVIYRANHVQLTEAMYLDPDEAEIDLPYTHLEPLLLYVASRVMNPIGFAGGNGFHEGNNYLAKFEAACAMIDGKGLQVDQETENTRLQRNGWV